MRWTKVALLTFALAALGTATRSETSVPESELRAAVAEADKNKDGQIDREEFHVRMVEIFFHGDVDKDGYMTPEELNGVTKLKEDFTAADANGDGKITLYEFIEVRFDHFRTADTDSSGTLSADEVVAFSEK